jgi:hypothetical protein
MDAVTIRDGHCRISIKDVDTAGIREQWLRDKSKICKERGARCAIRALLL